MNLRNSLSSLIGIAFLSFLPSIAHADHKKDRDEGPIAYYPLNGNALDRSGNNNDGVALGGSWTLDRFGKPNQALKLQRNGYIEIANDKLLDGATAAAISGWFQSELQPGEYAFVIGAGDSRSGLDPFVLYLSGEGYILQSLFTETPRGPYASNGFVGFNDPQFKVPFAAAKWNSFVMQFSSTKTSTIFQLFVNGSMVRHFEYPYSLTVRYDQPMPVQIGALTGFQNVQFRGSVDEVRFYDHTLNLEEIAQLSDPSFKEKQCGKNGKH